jgi:mRNA interferase MazF
MQKGDIVLVPFPFTNLTGNKNRPALILYVSNEDVLVCFITTQYKWQDTYSVSIKPDEYNGLKKESLIRVDKIITLEKELLIGKLGVLSKKDLDKVNQVLKQLLAL